MDMEPALAWVHPVGDLTCGEWLEYSQGEHDAAQSDPGAIRLIHTSGTPIMPEPISPTFHDIPYAYSYLDAPQLFQSLGLI
jgi:hypothetical protein